MFLIRNNLEINVPQKEIYKLMIKVSSGQLSKKELTVWLKNNTKFIN
jgi:death-on-curing protein